MNNKKIIICKLQDSYGGNGIEKIFINDKTNLKELFNKLCNTKSIVEEYIIQHDDMNRLSSSSVNTIRALTINKDGEVKVIGYFLRVGNELCVDNFKMGGFICKINEEKGLIEGKGVNNKGNYYKKHPISGTKFDGFRIPFWNEVKELSLNAAEKAKLVTPNLTIIGWDIAITQNKAILIEGNPYPSTVGIQLVSNKGMKEIFQDAI